MFDWLWGGPWSALKKALGSYAKTKAFKALSVLKDLRASTTSELADLLAATDTFLEMKLSAARTLDKLTDPKNSAVTLELRTVPMKFFTESPVLANLLATKLKASTELNALRNKLGVVPQEWDDFLDTYATSFVKYFAPLAIRKLIDNDSKVYGNELIVAVAEAEPYRIGGVDDYHDMVKFFDIPTYKNRETEIKAVRKLWKRRQDITYRKNV